MFVNLFNFFECFLNVCINVSNVYISVRFVFEMGECDCGDEVVMCVMYIVLGDRIFMCVSIIDGLDKSMVLYRYCVECVNLYIFILNYFNNKLLCFSDIFDSNMDVVFVFEVFGFYFLLCNGINELIYCFYFDIRFWVNYNDVRG